MYCIWKKLHVGICSLKRWCDPEMHRLSFLRCEGFNIPRSARIGFDNPRLMFTGSQLDQHYRYPKKACLGIFEMHKSARLRYIFWRRE